MANVLGGNLMTLDIPALQEELLVLEDDYHILRRKSDLEKINEIRRQLNMPILDANLKVPKALPPKIINKKEQEELAKAQDIYDKYLEKKAELKKHHDYALAVEKATGNGSMTCVKPLATMGTNGGPLLCDVCKKPMILEGGKFHKKYADEAWNNGNYEHDKNTWLSYIKGGMVIDITLNGTLRVYHGYPVNKDDCCEIGKRRINDADEKHDRSLILEHGPLISKFVETKFKELKEKDRCSLISDILNMMFGFDPGLGVNQP